jgi:hypothetical protein
MIFMIAAIHLAVVASFHSPQLSRGLVTRIASTAGTPPPRAQDVIIPLDRLEIAFARSSGYTIKCISFEIVKSIERTGRTKCK